jgi:hypothetical protein
MKLRSYSQISINEEGIQEILDEVWREGEETAERREAGRRAILASRSKMPGPILLTKKERSRRRLKPQGDSRE